MIIKKLDFPDFVEAFRVRKRQDTFSLSGLKTLYDFLMALPEPYELDVIALCCEFQELEPHEVPGLGPVDPLDDQETLAAAGGMPCDNGNWIFPADAI